MSKFEILQFPCLSDNYGVLLHCAETGETLSIDAPDAAVISQQLSGKGWRLTHIFNTHHHNDHTGGNLALKKETGCRITGPAEEAQRIPGLDIPVGEGTPLAFAGSPVTVLNTPGHTLGHISYWFEQEAVAFTGDTLFALGCGRVFEGTAQMMWRSLEKLIELPARTTIYCGHEYTLANARFAIKIEPENLDLAERLTTIENLRASGAPTLPTTLADELATNPFLRVRSSAIRQRLGLQFAPDWQVFAELRQRKNKG